MTEQQPLLPASVGETLRQARRERKKSLASVARALRVPVDVVETIEADQLERFASVYRKGYIRKYSAYLGLNSDQESALLEQLEVEQPQMQPVFAETVGNLQGARVMRGVGVLLASILVASLAWTMMHETIMPDSSDTDIQAVGSVMTTPPAAIENIMASEQGLAESEKRQAGQSAQQNEPAESSLTQPPDLADTSHLLRVSASGDSWIEIIDGNGTSLELDLLRAGAERDYKGVAPFRVLLGRSSAVKLYLNGRQVDVSEHTTGNVTQMSVDVGFSGQVLEEGQDRGS